jgi:prepilin-type N-terminal cleavage/methylation domain-containing protein
MKLESKNGFTLIELLVVIAIIGILSGILFVSIKPKEQVDKAKTAKLVSQFNQMEKAFLFCFLDENRSDW